jgi:hypothetical protein
MGDELDYRTAVELMQNGGRLVQRQWHIIGVDGWVSDEVAEQLLGHPDIVLCDGEPGEPVEWEFSKYRR